MYPSDYGYATDFNACTTTLYGYDSSGCYNNDWLYNSANQWLLTPDPSDSTGAWTVPSAGNVNNGDNVKSAYGVRPVFFLNSELGIVSGDGSESNPYVVR